MDENPQPRLRRVDRRVVVPALVLEDLVGPDHPVRAIWDYVCALNLQPLLTTIRALEGVPGRNATDPRILLAVWMWAVCDGIGTARAVDTLCREHNAYRWLAGGVSLNYHTLATFRSTHEATLDGFLTTHVSALLHQGLIELSCVAQDGMRTRASAGAGSFRRGVSIEECESLVQQQIVELKRQDDEPLDAVSRRQQGARKRHAQERAERLAEARKVAEQLQAKQAERVRLHPKEALERGTKDTSARASTTDAEARRMKMPDGGTRPGYNVQFATTTGTGIIVGVSVTNQGSDGGLMGPMIARIEKAHDRKPKSYLVDGGFSSKEDVESAHASGIAVYAPLKNEKRDVALGQDPYAPKTGDGEGVKAWRQRMGTVEAKELYKQRASTAEWVNAGMRQRGLYRLTVRGLSKVRAVVLLQALVHNVRQTMRLLKAKKREWNWQGILRAESRVQVA